ncbi:MAG: hypothetical protein C5B51_11710 [Terriglobia bacterium]|nr:MAG: hypothetical protein C5B51_11710 [Terriglobia bacterium]
MSKRLALLCCATAIAFAQTPGSIFLSAASSRLVCGAQLQVAALVVDRAGNAIGNAPLAWASSDSTIASVDSSGTVTAILPGIITITAASGGVRGTFQLQTVPLRIDVTPADRQLKIGDQVQYAAAVLDINQQPLSVPVTWQVSGGNGGRTSTAAISNSGLLTGYASASLIITASVVYTNVPAAFTNQFMGITTATILPPGDYRLRRLLTTDDMRQSFRMLGRRGGIAVNDSEQLVTVAALDGLSAGVLLAEQGNYQILASGGTPTLNPGGNLIDFQDPVINNRGNVLVRADGMGNAGGLLMLAKNQFQYLLTDGTTSGYTDFENTNVSRFSLNDNGAVVFRASYLPSGSSTRATGLFDLQRGSVNLDVSSPGTTLPGLNAGFNFDADFGMDGQGAVYFSASDGTTRGVYRVAPDGAIAKALKTGDAAGGGTVRNIFRLGIGFSGDLAIGCDRSDGSTLLLRFPGGNLGAAPNVLPLNGFSQIYSVNAAGVLFLGDGGRGWGLYVWPPKAASANLVVLQGRPAPAGDVILEIQAAAMTSAGVVFAKVRTAAQPLEILRFASGGPAVALQSGDRLSVSANLTLRGVVPGAANGDAHPLMGGFQSSIFQVNDTGLMPRVLLGDRLNVAPYYGNVAVKAPDGTLYVAADDSLSRVGPNSSELVLGFPRRDTDGVIQNSPSTLAANDNGQVAWVSFTNQNHSRVSIVSGGKVQVLAYAGANPQYRTASPAGGYFANWQEIAMDNSGRVMARFTVNGGPSGYFLWANGQWSAAALFGQTKVNDLTVEGANEVKAGGGSFYAILTQRGTAVLAQYTDSGWNPLFSGGQALPSGAALNSFRNLAVNRAGEVAFSANADGGFPEIVALVGDTARLVFAGDQPLTDGSFLFSIPQIDFRDDRRVFFLAFDLMDRVNLYVAEPLY